MPCVQTGFGNALGPTSIRFDQGTYLTWCCILRPSISNARTWEHTAHGRTSIAIVLSYGDDWMLLKWVGLAFYHGRVPECECAIKSSSRDRSTAYQW